MINKNLISRIKLSKKDKIKGLILPNNLSPNLAYLCGVMIGDGSIYCREAKNDYVINCVGNPQDEKRFYTDVLGPCFKRVFGFLPNIKEQDSGITFGFRIYSKALFEYFTKVMGLPSGKKYSSLKIPDALKIDNVFLINCIKGIIDTDGSIAFKKKYRTKPYYPVISLSSKSKSLIKDVAKELKKYGFKIVETYDYKLIDNRIKNGFTVINRIELNGKDNLKRWLSIIGFSSPKHLAKIEKYWKE